MTEEIIIDGINVAGCKDYREVEYKEMPICMNYYNHLPKPPKGTEWQYCAGNKNCYYKQLKRLEQENKKLKYLISEEQCFEEGCKKCTKAYYTDDTYRSALEEIRGLASPHCTQCSQIINIINEVLQ